MTEKTWSMAYALRKRREWAKENAAKPVEERISCDNCGDKTSAWDWTPGYDRFCLECLARQNDDWDYDPRADRGCHEYHQYR